MTEPTVEKDVAEPRFGFPVGPWFRWFAWHPTATTDRGWRWLRPVWRRRYQTHDYLDGPTCTWFVTRVLPPKEKWWVCEGPDHSDCDHEEYP